MVPDPLRRGRAFRTTEDVFAHAHAQGMLDLEVEQFHVLLLNAKNPALDDVLVSQGTLTNSLVHPREVFRSAIRAGAAGVILVHNHPSGDASPSPEDIDITRRLVATGQIVGIEVLDHVVVARGEFRSFRDTGLLPT